MSDWLTWQIVDSAFPTGAFAHSWGLESAWQHGEVDGVPALRRFLEASVHQTGHGALPLVNAAFDDPGRLEALDDLADAFLVNRVANRASRIQGRTLVATAAQVWPLPAIEELEGRVLATAAHAGPVSGAVFRTLGLTRASTQRVVLFGAARGVLSAAVRLGIVGSYEAQRLQTSCMPWLDRVAVECADLGVDDLAQTAPLIDLLQAGHDRLYSRLFQS
jgi:urease accessory protein